MNIEKICKNIFHCGDKVHEALGGGFTEGVNQNALTIEFREMGLPYLKEVNIEIFYKGRPQVGAAMNLKGRWQGSA